jgi:hypothetical protein
MWAFYTRLTNLDNSGNWNEFFLLVMLKPISLPYCLL